MVESLIISCWLMNAWVNVETANDLDYYVEDTSVRVYVVAEVPEVNGFICQYAEE